jgi:hypothetical protein
MPRIENSDSPNQRPENIVSTPAPAATPKTEQEVLRDIRFRLWADFRTSRKVVDECEAVKNVLCSCRVDVAVASAKYLSFVRHPFFADEV